MTERDLEAPDTDVADQLTPATGAGIDASDTSAEVDPADRAEGQRSVTLEEDDGVDDGADSVEVDPADRAEQQRAVAIDDDEYR